MYEIRERGSMNNNNSFSRQPSMDGRERVKREKRLYDASLSGSVESLNELMKEDRLTLSRVSLTCFNESPLHTAAMLGHVDFVKALLSYKIDLVTERDSQGRAPLHLAAANGYIDIVKVLLIADSSVCLFKDEVGRTPLHLAVMKGRADVVNDLARSGPEVTRWPLDRSETILHSCVIYNRLEPLKVLVELIGDDDFVHVADENGNTILHTAITLKRMEITKYLLSRSGVRVNATNENGLTALDIIEHTPRDLLTMEITELLVKAGALRGSKIPTLARDTQQMFRDVGDHNIVPSPIEVHEHSEEVVPPVIVTSPPLRVNSMLKHMKKQDSWLEKKRDSILVAATVIASMAYQAGLNPPSGVWQDDNLDQKNQTAPHSAGTSILGTKYPTVYTKFWIYNTVSLISSLTVILLVISGLPIKRRIFMWLLMVSMWVTISFMALTYLVSMQATSPDSNGNVPEAVFKIVLISVGVWLLVLVIVFFVHSCRFIIWIISKVRKWIRRRASMKGNILGEGQLLSAI